MILSDREIRAALDRDAMTITPLPQASAWSSTAIDLSLDRELVRLKKPLIAGVPTPVSPAEAGYRFDLLIRESGEQITMSSSGHVFPSGEFLLAWTTEKIQLPHRSRLAARVEGKSSLARLGIGVHVTAPTIHAGFGFKQGDPGYVGSPLQLEMWNCGPLDIKLVPGMPICQLIVELVDGTPEKGYDGRFSIQGPKQLQP